MRNNKLFSSLVLLGFLGSCAMTPKYEKPQLPVADEIPSQNLETEDISENVKKAAHTIAWKDFFQSKSLQNILAVTIENNRDLRAAALNVKAAQELYRIERSDILPEIDLVGSASRVKTTKAQSIEGIESTSSTYRANVATTSFELDLFGKLRSQNQSALEEFFASEENKNAVQIALVAQTANAYLQWLADKKILNLVEETLEAQQKSYNLIEKSHKSGVASKLDLAQVRTALGTARVNKALYSRRVEQGKNALILLMGIKNSSEYFSGQSLDDIKVEGNLPVNLSSEVLLFRPDIKKAEHMLKSANADIGAARAAFFPTISLTGSFGFASRDLSGLFSGGAGGAWSFAPQISVPIFKAGGNKANLEYSKVQKDIAIASYEKSIQNAFKEVADELVAKRTLKDELAAQRQLVKATKDAYELSYARYQKGVDSFLNVLDAQRSLFTAQQKEVEVEKLLLSNLVNLYKALGGGQQ